MPESKKRKLSKEVEDNNGSSSHLKPIKKLSCQRCRSKKVKCDGTLPCAGCLKAQVECIQTISDMRKKRPTLTYVNKIENQLKNVRAFINELKQLDSEKQTELLKNTDLTNLINDDEETESGISTSAIADHNDDVDETKAIYGPTSVYDNNIIKNNTNSSKRENEINVINKMNKDPEILKCIQLFFTWQYPDHNMFIFREAFLIDFFNPTALSLYCSKILILSICALGSRMAKDSIYNKSKEYYKEAKALLLQSLSQPSITSLQSFMLLAFFDICNGSNSSGWMLSGNAMRMGFDIGFQLNPEVWFVKSKESLDELDVAIRSRIYWGCYMADHFISLVLGRPSILKMSDASIPETKDLPDLEWIDGFTYNGYEKKNGKITNESNKSYIGDPLNQIINLINISDNILNDIFTKTDVDDKSNEEINLESRLDKLYEYNSQIMNWKQNLPDDLKWDKNTLSRNAENPTYSGIRYYYYILLLCLNRPFVGLEADANNVLSSLSICLNVIEDLYESIRKFESEHGYRRASIFIVYSSILSISIILLTNSTFSQVNEHKERLHFFMSVLLGCSKTWKLADKSYNLIKDKLKQNYVGDTNGNTIKTEPVLQINKLATTSYQASPVSSVDSQNFTNVLLDDNIDFLGGPPVLMTSDLFNEDWEALFPDYIFHSKN
ncbi:uncharacterized protein KGF55_004273 [Candida pseudojiufengensis]|uniref:uncharacterized protein n=1 Tax=Candida pseudojiufengensis TaxID=497109 RepID=UPI002223F2BD|nr:uncharacterized protein KGF55_004273 [Candida pseudojiufengensis]KAI5961006.1 hypothetical protein KGF55_004273 [Candida pseudojiufengensis]